MTNNTINKGADFWRYEIGANIIPMDSRIKMPLITWKEWQEKPIPEELHNQWKNESLFSKGIAVICGKLWHKSENIGKYLAAIDCDNKKTVQMFLNGSTIEDWAKKTLIEQHLDDPNRMHIYFITNRSIRNKSSDVNIMGNEITTKDFPAFEAKGNGNALMCCSPSLHKNGYPYQILGTKVPSFVTADKLESDIDSWCKQFGISYFEVGLNEKPRISIEELFKPESKIFEGHNRHEALLRIIESLLKRNINILDINQMRNLAMDWNAEHCIPPLQDEEFEKQWKDALRFVEKKNEENRNNTGSKFGIADETSQEKENSTVLSVSEASRLHSGICSVRGTISSISELHKMITSTELVCIDPKCDFQTVKEYKNPIHIAQFENRMKCPKCKNILESTPRYVNAVTVELRDSESFNDLDKIRVFLFDKDTYDVIVGENVIITGEIDIIKSSKKGKAFSVLYAASINYENKEELELTDLDIEAVKRFRDRFGNDIIKKLVSMTAPSIIGHDEVKEGILLSAANTNEDDPDKRTRIHILLVGPTGLAKTALLRQSIKIVPKSSVENAQTSSGLSLLAIVDKEEDTYVLRLGPVPRARGAICGIDELNRMSFQDQDKLFGVMQEGLFSNNKYGINARIRSPTTIIATANPVDSTHGLEIDDKIDLSQILIMPPVLDRFDLKFVFKQMKSQEEIREFTYQLSDKEDKKITDYSSFLKKFILCSKEVQPKISDEAKSILNEYYISMVKINSVSPRVRASLFNLTRARAKLKLKHIADAEDAQETIRFYDSIIKDYNNDVHIPEDPRDRAYRECIRILIESKIGISLDELVKMICERIEQVKRYLCFGNKPLRLRDNKKVRNLYEMLIAHKNVRRIQINPIVLQWFDGHEDAMSL